MLPSNNFTVNSKATVTQDDINFFILQVDEVQTGFSDILDEMWNIIESDDSNYNKQSSLNEYIEPLNSMTDSLYNIPLPELSDELINYQHAVGEYYYQLSMYHLRLLSMNPSEQREANDTLIALRDKKSSALIAVLEKYDFYYRKLRDGSIFYQWKNEN